MREHEFNVYADGMMARIEAALEKCPADLDYETGAEGVIEIEFAHDGGSKIVINRHAAAREIWIAAKSGGYHFRLDPADPRRWIDTRSGIELMACLARVIGEQSGDVVTFA